MANATVAVHNQATGETKTVTADAVGHYAATGLLPGTYTITVDAAGFAEAVKGSVALWEQGAM